MKSFLFLVFAIVVLATAPTPAKAQSADIWGKNGTGNTWAPAPQPPIVVVVKVNK